LAATRTPFYGVVLTLPVLLIYESLIIYFKYSQGDYVRNAADIWIKFFIERFGAHGAFAFGLLMLALIFLAFVSMVRQSLDIDIKYILLAISESCLYAFLISFAATRLTSWAVLHLVISQQVRINLVLALGAGVYEELIFRAFGYGLLPIVLSALFYHEAKKSGKKSVPRRQPQPSLELKIFAAVFTSLIFSWLHNQQSFSLTDYTPLYRFVMGLFFCILYEFRGLGIAVWTHSLYDVFVILYGQ
jgi:membrane protease YdiL (CAAX protease family)